MIIDSILNIVNKFIPSEDKQIELKKEMLKHEAALEKVFSEYSKRDMDLRIKEIESNGFKAWWRPFIMFSLSTCLVTYVFMFYVLPQIIVVLNIDAFYLEPVPIPDTVWYVFMYCVLGIGGLRTIEKTVRTWKSK